MSLAPPASIGPYSVESELGRGGMGVVYLARDARLDRRVAIKALPEHLAVDSPRLARFQREAKLLASMNHSNIGAIYGIEEVEGHQYLILEYVEGETLADRINRGAMPLDEALPLAKQIAEALEVAHEKGIVHRDLKPGNVIVTPDGVAKVLDFGLARTVEGAPASAIVAAVSDSPTLAAPAPVHTPTTPGVILGTAGYMSPEQARGRSVDKRSDIFSFGCVLYEMLTGTQPFQGESVADSLGAVLHRDPDWALLPASTPARIQELLSTCLAKDRRQRLHDIGDARLAIENAGVVWTGAAAAPAPARPWLPWGAGALVCVMAGVAAWVSVWAMRPGPMPLVRTAIEITAGALIDDGDGPVALSPDGRTLAFAGGVPGEPARIWIRSLDSLSAQPLQGTDGATYPFWSPDGKSLGFFANGKLRRIPAAGGTVTPLTDAEYPRGGTWGADGTIVFAPYPFGPLQRIAASGGTPTALTAVEDEQQTHRLPCFLPDGKSLLYTSSDSALRNSRIMLLDLESGKSTALLNELSQGLYAPTGYLHFLRNANLMAQRLDVSKGALVGEATVLAENVSMNVNRYSGAVSVSAEGSLVYRPSRSLSRLQWFDIEGRPLGTVGEPANIVSLSLAPGGERAAAMIRREDGKLDIWICDTVRGTRARFVEDVVDAGMTWSRAGGRIAYTDLRSIGHVRETDGETKDTVVTEGYISDWTADGKLLCLTRQDSKTFMDLYLMDSAGGEPRPFRRTAEGEMFGVFSPDSRWLAYLSSQSGRLELVVAPVTGAGAGQIASSAAGTYTEWLDDGTLVFGDAAGEKLLAIPTRVSDAGIEFDAPKQIFGGRELPSRLFAVTRDGKRVLAAVPVSKGQTDSLVLVQNWPNAVSTARQP